jgi:hypothetical protein
MFYIWKEMFCLNVTCTLEVAMKHLFCYKANNRLKGGDVIE